MPDCRVSVNTRPALLRELTRLEKLKVITKVSEPTPWLSQLVMTHKKDRSVRICINPNELNKALLRERSTMPVMEDILHELKDARIFSKADLSSGYWHIELDEESGRLTSFMTPFGRYRWLILPFGLSVSAKIFQRNLIEALRDLPGVLCIADDVIIHGSNQEEHDARLSSFLSRCNEMGIKLNKQKFEHAADSICFMGHRITSKGLEADPTKIKAVMGMERPDFWEWSTT